MLCTYLSNADHKNYSAGSHVDSLVTVRKWRCADLQTSYE